MPEPRSVRPFWLRLLLGALLVLGASASATAMAAFREVDGVVSALRAGDELALGDGLAEADAGTPQTIMLVGSDKRAATARDGGGGARSDTVILVRLDPARGAIALMSLPRDLKVRIPGHGTDKLNAAYSIGGPRLTLETVKALTGLRINHVVNVDFRGFREAVDEIGCVYVDIDRRYFNDNSGPERYATIDIAAGYQRLCGRDALDYVRYRHEDNDLVRSARQQNFLREAKQQVGVSRLVSDRRELVRIFGRYTRSSIRTRPAVLRLLKLAVASARQPIREVHFEGEIGQSFVTASSASVKRLSRQFLGVSETRGPRGAPSAARERPSRERRRRSAGRPSLEDAARLGRDQALAAVGDGVRFPVFYPRRRRPGDEFRDTARVYGLRSPDGRVHNSYRLVLRRCPATCEYYGVQGTRWRSPPILDGPAERRRVDGRLFEIHRDGDRVRLVAWRTRSGVYWLSNTLLQTLSEREMLGIARSTRV